MNQNNVSNKPVKKVVKNKVHCGNNISDQLQGVFDYTKPQFHDTRITPLAKRSDYSDAVLNQLNFNDEYEHFKKRGSHLSFTERDRFAAHLSQKYLCDKLDKLGGSKHVSDIRKEVAKKIDELVVLYNKDDANNMFNNMSLTVEELSDNDEASSVAS